MSKNQTVYAVVEKHEYSLYCHGVYFDRAKAEERLSELYEGADAAVVETSLVGQNEDEILDTALRAELASLQSAFEASGGRGVDLANRIDEIRAELGETL
jgi:hypothetical protein